MRTIFTATVVAMAIIVGGCDHRPATGTQDASNAQILTPDQFRGMAIDKTKSEIRATFGQPDDVEVDANKWRYGVYNESVHIIDPASSRSSSASLQFSTSADAPEKVVEVTMY